MNSYHVTFPDGTTATAELPAHTSHVVVATCGNGWLVWGGFGDLRDAEVEAAYVARRVRQVAVVPAVLLITTMIGG